MRIPTRIMSSVKIVNCVFLRWCVCEYIIFEFIISPQNYESENFGMLSCVDVLSKIYISKRCIGNNPLANINLRWYWACMCVWTPFLNTERQTDIDNSTRITRITYWNGVWYQKSISIKYRKKRSAEVFSGMPFFGIEFMIVLCPERRTFIIHRRRSNLGKDTNIKMLPILKL